MEKICEGYKRPQSIYPAVKRIVVLGDIHGDYKYALKLLEIAELIKIKGNEEVKWIGKDTFVVQVGDQIDNCRPILTEKDYCNTKVDMTKKDEASDVKILELFTNLHNQAVKEDGAVISLIGNHELLNIEGDLSYVSYENIKYFGSIDDRREAFGKNGPYRRLLGCTRLCSVIIGSNLFVHGGIIKELIDKLGITGRDDIEKINSAVQKWLLNLPHDGDYVYEILKKIDYSMFWNRIFGSIPPHISLNDEKCVKYIQDVLKIFKVGQIIVGHTPQPYSTPLGEGINETCGKTLFRVDHAGAKTFDMFQKNIQLDREPQILEIIDDNKFMICKKLKCKEI